MLIAAGNVGIGSNPTCRSDIAGDIRATTEYPDYYSS